MSKQTKITKSARGRECQIRIPGVCNGDPETTVLAHLNGGGMGTKRVDIHGAYSCSACHQWVDAGYVKTCTSDERDLHHLRGVVRTQEIMLKEGLI